MVNITILSDLGSLKNWQAAVFARGENLNCAVNRKFESVQNKYHLSEYKLAEKLGTTRMAIRKWRGKHGKRPVPMPLLNLIGFNKKDYLCIEYIKMYQSRQWIRFPRKLTPLLSEIIGRHVGDGSITKATNCIKLATSDIAFAKLHSEEFNKTFGVKPAIIKAKGKCFEVIINSKPLCILFNKIFEQPLGEKAKIAHEPKIIIKGGKTYEIPFLRGIADTDGSVWRTKSNRLAFEIGSISKRLIHDCQRILNSQGFSTYIFYVRDKNYYRLRIPDKDVTRLRAVIGFKNPSRWKRF